MHIGRCLFLTDSFHLVQLLVPLNVLLVFLGHFELKSWLLFFVLLNFPFEPLFLICVLLLFDLLLELQ